MKILGYSERGVINALFYDISNSYKDKPKLISDLLNKTIFIHKKEKFNISEEYIILIEQSFSDFGDSDVLLLIENQGEKQAVFLEAKVKTYSRNKWRLVDEFDKFLRENDPEGYKNLEQKIQLDNFDPKDRKGSAKGGLAGVLNI